MKFSFSAVRECKSDEICNNFNNNLWIYRTAEHHKLVVKRIGFVLMYIDLKFAWF